MTGIQTETISFCSSVDGTGPMFADVAVALGARQVPVVAVMPGFHGTRSRVRSVVERLATKGLCAVGIDMRGRGESAGAPDAGGVEIHDIVDAVRAACDHCGDAVDRDTWHIVGYSGGGGNTLSAITRFPGRFVVAVSFFGISDYAMWYRSTSSDDCRRSMEQWIGGTPESCPEKYRARSSLLAAGNARWTDVHLFWDVDEVICPEPMNSLFKEHAVRDSSGAAHVALHCSQTTDRCRWLHGYPDDTPSLIEAEAIFVPLMLAKRGPIHVH